MPTITHSVLQHGKLGSVNIVVKDVPKVMEHALRQISEQRAHSASQHASYSGRCEDSRSTNVLQARIRILAPLFHCSTDLEVG